MTSFITLRGGRLCEWPSAIGTNTNQSEARRAGFSQKHVKIWTTPKVPELLGGVFFQHFYDEKVQNYNEIEGNFFSKLLVLRPNPNTEPSASAFLGFLSRYRRHVEIVDQ